MLLIASYIFYGWVHPWFLILIALTTTADWFTAKQIAGTSDPKKRKLYLTLTLVVNFSILGVFKYFNFFSENIHALASAIGWQLHPWIKIALPVGISFFTFQSASYVIDVYRGQTKACSSWFDYALFVSFFPQLVAGPIERSGHLLSQILEPRKADPVSWRSGLVLIFWGLFEKLVIADSCALFANKVFALAEPSFPILWAGVISFGFMIYADFSAYTDIARGSARVLGFEICENFRHPYLSQSPGEFWRRWHMSLSTWFRDYVYIPLGGSQKGPRRTMINLVITFFLSGLWHGASWNFVIWGIYHGVLVALWPIITRPFSILRQGGSWPGVILRVLMTYILMNIGWLFFREGNLSKIISGLTLNPFAADAQQWRIAYRIFVEVLLFSLPLVAVLPLLQKLRLIADKHDGRHRWLIGQIALLFILLFGIFALRCPVGDEFIYFAF